jgi:hypothetical protein
LRVAVAVQAHSLDYNAVHQVAVLEVIEQAHCHYLLQQITQ